MGEGFRLKWMGGGKGTMMGRRRMRGGLYSLSTTWALAGQVRWKLWLQRLRRGSWVGRTDHLNLIRTHLQKENG